ncbi:hypothetical protein AJ88_15915 [Mesorhizobium amorphae CCBAU 01583]|nr:hypothetical protein AJ88_15915 [Mesorhizobium amorphae CCBAU 01583]
MEPAANSAARALERAAKLVGKTPRRIVAQQAPLQAIPPVLPPPRRPLPQAHQNPSSCHASSGPGAVAHRP